MSAASPLVSLACSAEGDPPRIEYAQPVIREIRKPALDTFSITVPSTEYFFANPKSEAVHHSERRG